MKRLLGAIAALCLIATPAFAADSLAKVRATIAAHDAAEATHELNQDGAMAALTAVNTTQDARLKALEDKLAAMVSAAGSTAPAPGPALPTTVSAKGAGPVWNLQFRAAPVTTKNLLAEVAAGRALPRCWGYDAPTKTLYVLCDSDETGWDLRGVRIYNQGLATLKLRSSLICAIDTLDYCVRNGDDNGAVASVLELYGVRVFGKNTAGLLSSWSTVNSSGKAIFRAYDTDWIDADYRFLSAYTVEIARNGFYRAGVQTSAGAHIEQLALRGPSTITDSLFDARGSTPGGATGHILGDGGSHTLTRNIFVGAADLGAYFAIQGDANYALNDNIIQPGISNQNSPTAGYLAKNGGTAVANDNVGFAAGDNIDAALTAVP